MDIGQEPPRAEGLLPERLLEVGIHGVPRAREWDAVVPVRADAEGTSLAFVALPDGTLLVDDTVPDGAVLPFAEGLDGELEPPYRALAQRQDEEGLWIVGAKRIDVRELPGRFGDELEEVDGDEVMLGRRLDGDLFEVEVSRL